MPARTSTKKVKLFYSYAHEDEELRKSLENHLSGLRRSGVIAEWHDRRIVAGSEWKGQIDKSLGEADVILLLISSDFLASDYCYDVEMRRALERHEAGEAVVIPVVLRPVDWSRAPFGKLQALPTDALPVTSWENIDEAFTDVAKGIRAAVDNPGGLDASGSRAKGVALESHFPATVGGNLQDSGTNRGGNRGSTDTASTSEPWWRSRTMQAAVMTSVVALLAAFIGLRGPSTVTGIYRVRATVLDPSGRPVDEARVWSSMPAEPQRVAGGWEFNIPIETRPADGRLTIFATRDSAHLSGEAEVQLGNDRNPTVSIALKRDESASVSGMVQDAEGKALADVRVSVIGIQDHILTDAGGNFVLDIGAAEGEMVQVHAEKSGYAALTQSHLAGAEPAVLVLDKE